MNLEESFIQYKNITLNIIHMVKAEEYERLEEIFKQRQLVLDNISKIEYSKEELKKFHLLYDIDKLEKILSLEMKIKKESLLEKIKENNKRQAAMKGYNNLSTRAVFLSKEF
ncbi:hypothetical protein CBU02nite_06160 [Clostridium butyricum]|uniref:Flagellar protein FliT n=1 Tax=Clostridium butyricum TaxID=1492 RepID=A0A512TIN6_CLOBU|nr:hypothetical protein [Clostridium butyricum]NOW23162.1 hypothetical protein [Clostridium butyricum]GEQ20110.1 hypothetical protein CBU02nite_06160 [Clostridium butyricum]